MARVANSNLVEYVDEKDTVSTRLRTVFKNWTAKFIHCEGTSCHVAPGWAKSWLQLWKMACDIDKHAIVPCAFEGCAYSAFIGAHVRYSGSRERYASWYIVPACIGCNNQRGMGAKLKRHTRLLKVMDGKVVGRNRILFGSINAETASAVSKSLEVNSSAVRVLAGTPRWEQASPKPRSQREQTLEFVKSVSQLRRWPCGRIGSFFGWRLALTS